jgi:D-beta-D-heptose 7-phosphate kinase/D-beta-D-heptose 1-phosphate adenosyltransferase
MSASKIHPVDSLSARIRALKSDGKRVVFTNGCFDLLHTGHLELFDKSRQYGDVLVVAINSDASVRRLKGKDRPILTEHERGRILAALEVVDYVCVFDEDTPLETIDSLRPDVLVKGADWKDKGIVGQGEVEGWGGQVVIVSLVEGKSTTGIVERIRASGGS